MISVNQQSCIGCGHCLQICPIRNFTIKDGKAFPKGECFECGHCTCVCPQNAIVVPGCLTDDVEPCPPTGWALQPEQLMKVLKSRRSVRNFKPDPLQTEEIRMILEAGRLSPTACNRQSLRCVFVQEKLPEFKSRVWDVVGKALQDESIIKIGECPKEQFRTHYEQHTENPEEDYLFRNAPAALILACDYALDAGMAAMNMEHMARALGLGVLFDGMVAHACRNEAMGQWIGTEGKYVAAVLLLGTPDVRFMRTAPRKPANAQLR